MCIPFTYNVYTIHILFTYNVTFVDIVHIKCVYRSHTMSLLWKPFTYNVTFVNTFDIQCHLCVYRSHTMSTLFIPLIGVYFSNGTQCHLVHHSRCIMSPSQYTSTLAPSTAPRTVKKTSKKGFIEYQRNSMYKTSLLQYTPAASPPYTSPAPEYRKRGPTDWFWCTTFRTNQVILDNHKLFDFSPGTVKSMTKRSHSRLKFIREQFWYRLLPYELVNPTIKTSLLNTKRRTLLQGRKSYL